MTPMQKAFQKAIKDADSKVLAGKVQRALAALIASEKPLAIVSAR